uniref:Uncharacterized protein n=1 Tax=Salmo trutta TaxID=8032 RepID=A0A673Z5Q5_SALTR
FQLTLLFSASPLLQMVMYISQAQAVLKLPRPLSPLVVQLEKRVEKLCLAFPPPMPWLPLPSLPSSSVSLPGFR